MIVGFLVGILWWPYEGIAQPKTVEAYLRWVDLDQPWSVSFALAGEELYYGTATEAYDIRQISTYNYTEEDREAVEVLLDSLVLKEEINAEAYADEMGAVQVMTIYVTSRNGAQLRLWALDPDLCDILVSSETGEPLCAARCRMDAEASAALRDRGNLPPIPSWAELFELQKQQEAK